MIRKDNECRVCSSSNITTVFQLKDTPLEDQFVSKDKKNKLQSTYPLELALCEDCGYLFLPHIISPEASYLDYTYVSGVTHGLRNHYDNYAEQIVNEYDISKNSFVVDLGSNDGSMLSSFQKQNMKVVGVEPASTIAKIANESGQTTINAFFTEDVVSKILKEHGKADVITANYMYANIDDVVEFTKNVSSLLNDGGVFVVQTGYHPEQMKINMFDYIYHEHFSYFTVEVLSKLFDICGIEIIDAVKTSPKGGSIRVVGQLKGGARNISASLKDILEEEHLNGMRSSDTYIKFAKNISTIKRDLRSMLDNLKENNCSIVGFGASHSTTTLMYHFELDSYLDYIVDNNELKYGLYSPGYHLPVYSADKIYQDKPQYILILAWQHQDIIIERNKKFLEQGGKFIVPLPVPKIVEA